MHEKILQGVTIGVVAGLFVYWLTSTRKHGFQTSGPDDYSPLVGDVRGIRGGRGTCACCQCCGLPAPNTTTTPLASDYLYCTPDYRPATSEWNLGVSLNIDDGLHADVYAGHSASTDPHGMAGPNSVPRPVVIVSPLSCSPDVPGCGVCCTEIV